jgi:hypothetical protein
MISVDRLRGEWRERVRSCPLEPFMTLNDKGLMLGAGTGLARQRAGAAQPSLSLEGAEERVLAMLSVASGKAVAPRMLDRLRRAAAAWRDGETALANIHLALADLPRLDAASAYRLFAADRLPASGIDAATLLKACDIDTAFLDLVEAGYNPDEPRVPAGSPDGGEWTTGGTSAAAPTPLHGEATVYNKPGHRTATGDIFDPNKMTGAVLPGTMPLGSTVTVTLDSDPSRSIEVLVNDHGLYRVVTNPDGTTSRVPLPGRVIDLSPAAFEALTGTAYGKVRVTVSQKSAPVR